MIRTTKTTFEQEEKNTEFFQKKLEELTKKSKNLKEKNSLPLHKSLFVSDWHYFKKIEYIFFKKHFFQTFITNQNIKRVNLTKEVDDTIEKINKFF